MFDNVLADWTDFCDFDYTWFEGYFGLGMLGWIFIFVYLKEVFLVGLVYWSGLGNSDDEKDCSGLSYFDDPSLLFFVLIDCIDDCYGLRKISSKSLNSSSSFLPPFLTSIFYFPIIPSTPITFYPSPSLPFPTTSPPFPLSNSSFILSYSLKFEIDFTKISFWLWITPFYPF